MKKHVFLSFNVEYGTNGHKNTVKLLDARQEEDFSDGWAANATHESMVQQIAAQLITKRLRIEEVKMGVRP